MTIGIENNISASRIDGKTPMKLAAIAAARDALYATNNSNSPLLSLPAELRNSVYEYVLGGLDLKPCENGMPKLQARASNDGPRGTWGFRTHLLAITQTCRQIQEEASLLPFTLNTFYIAHAENFLGFIATLTPRQRNSVTTLSCHHCICGSPRLLYERGWPHSFVERYKKCMDSPFRGIFPWLKGLKRLSITAEIFLEFDQTPEDDDRDIEQEKKVQESAGQWLRDVFAGTDVEIIAEEVFAME